jgi:hypothetical protein
MISFMGPHMMTASAGSLKIAAVLVLAAAACREAPPAKQVEAPQAAPSAPAASAHTLPVPFESEGACPFECCVYRTWSVRRATDVRTTRDTSAPVAFSVKDGDEVEALTGVVVVSRPGRARASRDVKVEGLGDLHEGDEVAVLHPLGEGFWLVWRDGRKGSGQVGEKSARPGPWDPELNPIEKPEFTWWVQVRDGKTRTGWTDAPGNFGNKDRCG